MNNSTSRVWRVEPIKTVPMRAQQYHFAVTALAALIEQWIHKLETISHNNDATEERNEMVAPKHDTDQKKQEDSNGQIGHHTS